MRIKREPERTEPSCDELGSTNHPWGGGGERSVRSLSPPTGMKCRIARVTTGIVLAVLVIVHAGNSQTTSDGEIDAREYLQDLREELDDLSLDLADEYLEILEELRDIIDDYSDYLAELDPEVRKRHPISLKRFSSGLRSGRYAESHEALLEDIQAFVGELRSLEKEHSGGMGETTARCCRVVRNLRREMSMLEDLTVDYAESVRSHRQWDETIEVYLEEALRGIALVLSEHKLELLELEGELERIGRESDSEGRELNRLYVMPSARPEGTEGPEGFEPPEPSHPVMPPMPSFEESGINWEYRNGGEVGSERRLENKLAVTDNRKPIILVNPRGDIHVASWDEESLAATFELEIKSSSRAREKRYLSRADLDLNASSQGYQVIAELPELNDDPDTKILSSVLLVYVPFRSPVECENSFGRVYVTELGNDVNLDGQYSWMTVEDVKGNLSARNSMGSISLHDVKGSIEVKNGYGAIEIADCSGDMDIQNAYAKILLSDCRGDVEVSSSGNVNIRDHRGNVVIDNAYGAVEVLDLDGNLEVNNAFQPLVARGIRGSAELENRFSRITVEDIGGFLTIDGSHGTISGEGLKGPLKVTSSNGSISLLLDRNLDGYSTITANDGSIRLSMSRGSDIYLIAHAIDGTIRSQLPLDIRTDGSEKSVEHRFGQGSDSLAISGTNVSITIEGSL